MAAAKQMPESLVSVDYRTWLDDVRIILQTTMHMEMAAWLKNWDYDFRKQYDAGVTPQEAALRAHDFWWQQLLAESWT